jgi:peptide-methionine (S)-S-oxide reductase
MEKALFAAGCFWCVQDFYNSVPGVTHTEVGYTGGYTDHPTYEQVCTGTTGHAEVIKIKFNPNITSFENLLDKFWLLHDPTTLNRQGPDIGTQYRSAIFYTNENQKKISELSKEKMNKNKFKGKIVTEITKFSVFFPAEEYHQNYNQKIKKKYGIS